MASPRSKRVTTFVQSAYLSGLARGVVVDIIYTQKDTESFCNRRPDQMNPEADGEVRRFSDKQANFRGYASVDLKFLRFDCEGDLQVHLDEKNVCRLVQIFELEGCLRSEIEHHVPVVISDADLQAGLDRAHVAREELFSSVPPLLDFPVGTRLRCLHGRHRLEAAWRHLMPGDKRWTVDLYLDCEPPSESPFGLN